MKRGWGLDTKNIEHSIRPQDDFFRHVNKRWIDQNPIPKEESWWGSFLVLRRKSDDQVRGIMKDIVRGDIKGDAATLIRNFYLSGIDMKRRNALGVKPLAEWLRKINAISDTESLMRTIGELHAIGSSAFWDVSVGADAKDSMKNVFYFSQDGISLPDRDYYVNNDAESKRIRAAYVTYIERMSARAKLTLSPLGIETALAHVSTDKVTLRDPEKNYYPYTSAKLSKISPLPWAQYFKGLGMKTPHHFIVCQVGFMKGAAKIIATTPLEEIKSYLAWHLVNTFTPYLSHALVKEKFVFYGTALSGTAHMRPLWRRVQTAVEAHIGEELGRIYVERHFTRESKRKIDALVSNLFVAFEKRIRALEWMSPVTKRKALHKLRTMDRKIGYPKKWKSFKGLVIKSNDYCGNAIRTNLFETKRAFRKIGKKVDRAEWHMTPQTVNAYYNPRANEIVFPAAILQWPFFDAHADDALNYGAIGWTIGHEMTHGFDDEGSKFDAHGNLKRWWSAADRAKFDERAHVLKRQFDAYEVLPGTHVNGALTLGENIADLGGVAIAYDAYQEQLKKTGRKDIDGYTPEQRFFLSLAQGECEHSRTERIRTMAAVDPHAPPKFRVNGPVSNLDEFEQAFKVTKSDALYRSPTKRARIW